MSVRRMIQDLLLKAGFEIHSIARWGNDLERDLARVAGRDAHIVLDVGANRGQAALRFLSMFPGASIQSFEPNPAALDELARVTRESGRVRCHGCALGSQEGEMTLNLAQDDVGSSLLPWSPNVAAGQFGAWTQPAGQVRVPVRRLDAVWAELGLLQADLLKVDTQGFDLQVLRGAGDRLRPDRVRAVQVELNFADYYEGQGPAGEVIGLLASRGYAPVGFYGQAGGARRPDGRLNWVDALFA